MLGRERTAALQFVCSDMWQPYLKVIAKKAGQTLHILDRYHLVTRLNKASDEVRAAEATRPTSNAPEAAFEVLCIPVLAVAARRAGNGGGWLVTAESARAHARDAETGAGDLAASFVKRGVSN